MEHASATTEEGASNWTGKYTWRVKNWTKSTERMISSPEFEIGGYSWRLLLFPKGNGTQGTGHYIELYLDFLEALFTPPQMCPKVTFRIRSMTSTGFLKTRSKESSHTFTSQNRDWGFVDFLPIQETLKPQSGHLVDDTLTVSVEIRLENDDSVGMTSKAKTGFVGIKTLGETSLLSSFLQCLFHVKVFRKAVYEIPNLESADPKKSLPLALQHLFCELQYQNTSVETKDLGKSLDLDFDDVFLQHDVVEIQRALFGKLAEQDKIGTAKDCISDLFMGEYSNYIKSPSMPEAQTSKQSYAEIPFSVLECKDIYASLEKFCQIKRLEENNHNRATGRGLNESKHYTLFDSFPTILQFNLEQYHYNSHRNAILKVNSRFEFYDELDLDYSEGILLSKDADRTIENKYRLHSVVVHAGSPNKGRYFAFIRCDEKWYKFDGEVVKVVTAEEAINAQFGDRDGQVSANFSNKFKSTDKSAAVMLVYIHKSEWNTVMLDAGKHHLPKQVKERFDIELMEKEDQQKKKEAHLYVNINLATEFHFAEEIGKSHYFGLANFERVKSYRIYKKTLFEDFKEMVSKDLGIPKHLQRFWGRPQSTNNSEQVSESLKTKGAYDLKTVLDLRRFRDKRLSYNQEHNALMTASLILETPEGHSPGNDGILHKIRKNDLLIFVKYYDPVSIKLSYLGHLFIKKTSPFRLVLIEAKKMAKLDPKDKVVGVKEVQHLPEVICSDLLPMKRVSKNQIVQGDIIIIQRLVKVHDSAFPLIKGFLESIQAAQKPQSETI